MRIQTYCYTRAHGWSAPLSAADDSPSTLVLVFGASDYFDDPAAIEELAAAYPRSHLIGCSTAGEILGTTISDGTLSVAVVRFERTELRSLSVPVRGAGDSFEAGVALAKELGGPSLRSVLVLSEGLNVNGSELVRGLNSVLPPTVVVTGGLAGDGDRFRRTWVIQGGKPRTHTITAVGFYGDHVRVGHGSKGGWDIFGPERIVTRSEGNVLYELDGQPALALYKKYLGDRASGLPATGLLFPLTLREGSAETKSLMRTILAVDEQKQSLTFAGDIPQGWRARLMKANFDRLIEGSLDAARGAWERLGDPDVSPPLTVAISCVGRRLILGERTEEEVESALDALPPSSRIVGFYSYGEISPYATGACDLHNQTMTLTVIAEA